MPVNNAYSINNNYLLPTKVCLSVTSTPSPPKYIVATNQLAGQRPHRGRDEARVYTFPWSQAADQYFAQTRRICSPDVLVKPPPVVTLRSHPWRTCGICVGGVPKSPSKFATCIRRWMNLAQLGPGDVILG